MEEVKTGRLKRRRIGFHYRIYNVEDTEIGEAPRVSMEPSSLETIFREREAQWGESWAPDTEQYLTPALRH